MNVLLPVVLTFGTAALSDLTKTGSVRLSVILGGFVYGAAMFALYEVNAEITLALAWVAALTSLLLNGQVVFKALGKGIA